jgi:mono/diheme cytochrome c family protein
MNFKPSSTKLAVVLGLLFAVNSAMALTPAQEGRKIYLSQNCYGCHGGHGGGGMGPNLRNEADDVAEAVHQGEEGGMPAYPSITAVQIQNLTAYFRSMHSPGEPTFTHWWEAVPTQ